MKSYKLLIIIFFFFCIKANAALITECGPNICYEYDDAQLVALSDEFGIPTLIGDDMRFLPLDFKAQSTDGVGIHTGTNTDNDADTFVFSRIYTISGAEIALITVSENGDYDITNDGTVSADLLMLVANNNDAAECDCDLAEFDASGASPLSLWSLDTSLSPTASFTSIANDISLTIQNTLSAYSDAAGEDAWIQKKYTLVSVTVVPLPAGVWLFASSLTLLGLFKRKTGWPNQ